MAIREVDLETAFLGGQGAYREGLNLYQVEREAEARWPSDEEARRNFIAGWRLLYKADLAKPREPRRHDAL